MSTEYNEHPDTQAVNDARGTKLNPDEVLRRLEEYNKKLNEISERLDAWGELLRLTVHALAYLLLRCTAWVPVDEEIESKLKEDFNKWKAWLFG